MDYETASSCLDPNSSYLEEWNFFPISLYKVSVVKTCQLFQLNKLKLVLILHLIGLQSVHDF